MWPGALLVLAVCASASADTLGTLGALLPPAVLQNFEELIKVASSTCEALPMELLLSRSFSMEVPVTEMVEFRRNSKRSYHVSTAHERVSAAQSPLIVYVPGWWNTPTDESSTAIVESLLTKHPLVLVLDTRLSFCRGYISSVSRVTPLSHLLFNFIKNLHKRDFNVTSIHLIGFSLGAHVAGLTGKLVQRRLKTKVGKITALDPAKPCFTKTKYKLDKSNADFVQVIHSSAGIVGLEEPIGHTDVYVNGVTGKHPECMDKSISIECDHAQAWRLYSASAMDDRSFIGKKCADWDEVVGEKCTGYETVLGYSCSPKSKGMFLYKSEERRKRQEPRLKVFNPFNFVTGWPFS